jgi:hypothetical protein
MSYMQSILELKTQPKLCPLSQSLPVIYFMSAQLMLYFRSETIGATQMALQIHQFYLQHGWVVNATLLCKDGLAKTSVSCIINILQS